MFFGDKSVLYSRRIDREEKPVEQRATKSNSVNSSQHDKAPGFNVTQSYTYDNGSRLTGAVEGTGWSEAYKLCGWCGSADGEPVGGHDGAVGTAGVDEPDAAGTGVVSGAEPDFGLDARRGETELERPV